MILYISGFGSTKKSYIKPILQSEFPTSKIEYYVLTNKFRIDLENLKMIIDNSTEPITIIGHSTGGFHALCLYEWAFPRKLDMSVYDAKRNSKIESIHLINPAINLIAVLSNNDDARNMLMASHDIISECETRINELFTAPSWPIAIYQGQLDDRIDTKFNTEFARKNGIVIQKYPHMGHRFDSQEFLELVKDISKNVLKPL